MQPGATDLSDIKVTTKADRVSTTNTSGVLVYAKIDGRQFIQAPDMAFPTVKQDMVHSQLLLWNALLSAQPVITISTASKRHASVDKNGCIVISVFCNVCIAW